MQTGVVVIVTLGCIGEVNVGQVYEGVSYMLDQFCEFIYGWEFKLKVDKTCTELADGFTHYRYPTLEDYESSN